MQNIPIALAQPDMVLAREVVRPENPGGPPICGRGIVLTESLIERLKTMGVQTLTVEGRPVPMEGERSLEELLADLERRFRRVAGTPLMDRLHEIYRSHLARIMGGGDGR